MHPRTEELLNFLLTSQIRLREAVDAVPPVRRNAPPRDGRWSVGQVLEHLALTERGIARLLAKRTAEARAAGLGADRETSSILWSLDVARVMDRRQPLDAPSRIQPSPDVTADEAWRRLQEVNGELRQAVAATDGLAMGELVFPHPFLGPLNLYQWAIFAGAHELRHAQQIREI
jgi:hypothetical protein